MTEQARPGSESDALALAGEVARLNKVNRALMDRAERSASAGESDFSRFQSTIMLDNRVHARTAELEAALAENEKINRALRESEGKFRRVVSQSLVGIAITEQGRFSYSNPKFDEIFGYAAAEIRMLGLVDLAAPEDRARVHENIHRRMNGEVDQVAYGFRGLRKDGTVIDVEAHGSVMELGGNRALVSLILDVTERVRAESELRSLQEKLREQAIRDPLTGLYNRRYLDEMLGRELIAATRADRPVSAIMADLDHFKNVNDRFGHPGGDEVLRSFGALLRRHARGSDICCRYGGEEFLLVLPGMSREIAFERAEQLRGAVAAARIPWGEASISMTASFGVATFPRDGATGEALIGAADGALYTAKESGRDRVCAAGPS